MNKDKRIEDYLHLYLGCELERGGIVTTALLDAAKISSWDAWQDFKPILRPLSDMSEEDRKEYLTKYGLLKDDTAPEQFRYLLSKHFDLFSLIEAGLAIDRTKT